MAAFVLHLVIYLVAKIKTKCYNGNMEKEGAIQIQSQKLAYIGDAVHTLYVRNKLLLVHKGNIASLAKECNKFCNAAAQEQAYFKFLNIATEDEKSVANRARNCTLHHGAKNYSIESYRHATAFEAVVGYLHITNQTERLQNILALSMEE